MNRFVVNVHELITEEHSLLCTVQIISGTAMLPEMCVIFLRCGPWRIINMPQPTCSSHAPQLEGNFICKLHCAALLTSVKCRRLFFMAIKDRLLVRRLQ